MNVTRLPPPWDRGCSQNDVLRAAEAVVDAALCCRGIQENLAPVLRASLVREVIEDPSVVEMLFFNKA